jgi:AAA domain
MRALGGWVWGGREEARPPCGIESSPGPGSPNSNALDAAAVGRVLDRAPHLSEEQRAAVLAATTGGDLAQIVGRAGAGKTTAAAAIAEAYREAG